MTRGLRGARRELARLRVPDCPACSVRPLRRHASTTAASTSHDSSVPLTQHAQRNHPDVENSAPRTEYLVRSSIVLSRPPQITRDLTPFEKAFFLYQRRMNERTAMPFPRYFYIPKATPQEVDWKRKIKERKTPARDIGKWSAWDRDEGWNDELLVGSTISEPSEHVERLLEDVKMHEDAVDKNAIVEDEDAVERPMPRVTEADKTNDTRSLNRALTRTLYFIVMAKDGRWQFPSAPVEGSESLHRAAERIIVQTGGLNMNTWLVGNAPIGHHTWHYPTPVKDQETGLERIGEKTFFMKGRIFAGIPDLSSNQYGIQDHQWLSRDELQKLVRPSYWKSIRSMLPSL